MASKTWNRELKIWDPRTGHVLVDLHRSSYVTTGDGQFSIAWSPRGDRLAAAYNQGEIIVWDTSTGHQLHFIQAHTSHVRAVAWSPDGKRLASVGYDRYVKIWDAQSARELLALPGHRFAISSVAWSPDGRQLATASNSEVKIWDASLGYALAGEKERK
jgi:WD40 repeat protein